MRTNTHDTAKHKTRSKPISQPVYRHPLQHWYDYYPAPLLPPDQILPKPHSIVRLYSTKGKRDNPNPKSWEGIQAYYNGMGMYPGMMGAMSGMYPGMMGMGGMGMSYPGMMNMGAGYGVRIVK